MVSELNPDIIKGIGQDNGLRVLVNNAAINPMLYMVRKPHLVPSNSDTYLQLKPVVVSKIYNKRCYY